MYQSIVVARAALEPELVDERTCSTPVLVLERPVLVLERPVLDVDDVREVDERGSSSVVASPFPSSSSPSLLACGADGSRSDPPRGPHEIARFRVRARRRREVAASPSSCGAASHRRLSSASRSPPPLSSPSSPLSSPSSVAARGASTRSPPIVPRSSLR